MKSNCSEVYFKYKIEILKLNYNIFTAFEYRKYVIKSAYNKQHAMIRNAFAGLFVAIAAVVTDRNHTFLTYRFSLN